MIGEMVLMGVGEEAACTLTKKIGLENTET